MAKTKKQQLRSQADKLFKQKVIGTKTLCEVCEGEPIETAHHFFPKGQFGHLRYNLDNGVAIGRSCHFAHHHKGDPRIHKTITDSRGEEWYVKLVIISREKPASYQSIAYYEGVINNLNE